MLAGMPDLLSWRPRFPILASKTYLINNSLGAMPASVNDALAEYTNLWATEGVVAWDTWLPEVAYTAAILEDSVWFDPAGGGFHLLRLVDAEHPRNRLNDAHVDAAGRLWFGTMDDDEASPNGALYRFDGRRLHRCDDDYVITNGPATSPDGRTLYHVDTLQRLIYAFALAADGSLSERRVFVRLGDTDGYPDGPVVDATGCIWVGLFGGWGVNRYSPAGELLSKLSLPVANCTKVAFGGDDLQTLYITTAWKGLAPGQRAQQPLAGGLFAARVDTPGLPANLFAHDR
jgi:sugar lactone lactonase YvrE